MAEYTEQIEAEPEKSEYRKDRDHADEEHLKSEGQGIEKTGFRKQVLRPVVIGRNVEQEVHGVPPDLRSASCRQASEVPSKSVRAVR